ncbi:type IX secretion system motor protein PorM/GldM [Saccharicrinis aurantiacus]|uniref:type IX secretion system motor protein PorM/GldM n=1 Tax=Saccharicrinis aurantiacus TaxID=1849719 RepID=UPI0008FF2755|nr:gliding motility protein GldM [Saccharicrinis aurantiacus]
MSGGNCPETPRQKMIGMMYLFLTAMLALNVSGELLQAFVTLDEGFTQSRNTVEAKNNVMYSQFENSYDSNKKKVEAHWNKAKNIKAKADSLVLHIEELKVLLSQKAGGPEATPYNYTGIDNQDIAPQIMITEKNSARSKELKSKIVGYKDFLLTYLNPEKDTMLTAAFNKTFNVDNIPVDDGVDKSWESTKFEHMPLAASMGMLSKIQGDVRNAEADVVGYLFNQIDASSFKFTTVKPLIIPTSTQILKGDEYEARLLFAAYDETNLPRVKVNGKEVTKYDEGKAVLQLPGTKIGENNWKGTITIKGPDGSDVTENIEGSYIVNAPSVVISPTKMNVFYGGVENPVDISVPGVSASQLKVNMSNVSFKKKGNSYIVVPKPGTAGKTSKITVYAMIDGVKQKVGSQTFRIKRVPNPIARVAGTTGGKVGKNVILAQKAVFAEMDDFDFDLEFKVTRFSISALKGGFIIDEQSKSNRITNEQRELIKGLSRGSKVSFENIRAKGPDGSTRDLGTVTLVVD